MKKSLILFLVLASFVFTLSAKPKKEKKPKKSKSKQKIEDVMQEDADVPDYDGVEFDDTEIITREQIDSAFSLLNQLNEDLQTALTNDDFDYAAELNQVIEEQKKTADSTVPALRNSSEWTSSDEERYKKILSDYKTVSKNYKSFVAKKGWKF